MNVGTAGKTARRLDEGTVGNVDTNLVMRTDEVAEERDLVGVYLHEISRTPLLDAAKEVELSKAIEAGLYAEHLLDEGKVPEGVSREELERLVAEGERAKDLFIRANLRLVVSIARRYVRSGMPMLDLIQEGNTGLVRAVEKFDYVRGYKFSTYATWWIRQAISRAIAQQERTVRLPVHLVEDVNRMRNVARQLTRELGRDPEPEQIAAALGVPVERVHELMRWSQDTVSLDTPVGDDGDTNLGDLVADSDAPSPEDVVLSRAGAAADRGPAEPPRRPVGRHHAGPVRPRGRAGALADRGRVAVLAVAGADPPAGDPGAGPAAGAGPRRGPAGRVTDSRTPTASAGRDGRGRASMRGVSGGWARAHPPP